MIETIHDLPDILTSVPHKEGISMNKKLLSLLLALTLVLGLAAAFADNGIGQSAASNSSNVYPYLEASAMVMYVYTDNGQGLNVRSAPRVANNIIAVAPYGSRMQVLRFLENGWASVVWDRFGEAYVQSRFLQWDEPAPLYTAAPSPRPTVIPTAVPTAAPYTPTYTDTLAVLNAEFRTARLVAPFVVSVRPSRASGWVNMRWAPSKDTEVLATYRSGAQLTVIAETQSWYQVTDPNTEATGFIMKNYVTRLN